ncbi:hypothetical protein T4B_1790, partial [Trichinella pseudospiralis]
LTSKRKKDLICKMLSTCTNKQSRHNRRVWLLQRCSFLKMS